MSFSKNTEKLVIELINEEYKNACSKYGGEYHSLHEAYGVLKEELEEVKMENKELFRCFYHIWDSVKADKKESLEVYIQRMIKKGKSTIKEVAQVCAVLEKFRDSL